MESVFTLDGTNSFDSNGTSISYDSDGTITEYSRSQSQNGDQVVFSSTDQTLVSFTDPKESPNDISDRSVTCIIYLTVIENDGHTDMILITVARTLDSDGQ